MRLAIRLVATLALAALLLFCLFGLMATLEPMPRSTQMTWRLIYGLAGILILTALVRLNRRRRNNTDE